MEKIKVKTKNRNYDVIIDNDLLHNIGNFINEKFDSKKTMIVTDDIVGPLYLDTVVSSLNKFHFEINTCILKAGEKYKNPKSLMYIIDSLSDAKISRTDTVIALGGGVISDITALAASLFLRGIRLIIIPTTLLAAVDASVGGKTGINLQSGKNRLGSFYQPHLVLISTNTLLSLNSRELENGVAEIIKYGMIDGEHVLNLLHKSLQPVKKNQSFTFSHQNKDLMYNINLEALTSLLASCLKIKVNFIEKDENDSGERQILNLGHTIAHGIEKKSDYRISHGRAVAIGLVCITKAAVRNKLCSRNRLDKLLHELAQYSLPDSCNDSLEELLPIIINDKKRRDDIFSLICPINEEKAKIIQININELYDFLKKGFE